jgi:hypothetical protein
MANLYFCQRNANNQGMLRAVLSEAQCKRLVKTLPAEYIGTQFPSPRTQTGSDDYAVLSVEKTDAAQECQPGYYRLKSDLDEVNAVLMALAK